MSAARHSKVSSDIPKRVLDQDAETILELVAATAQNETFIARLAARMVKEGKWERVCKKVGRLVVPAYRRIQ